MLGIMAAAVATAGCSSSMYSSSSPVAGDDLYATHDRKALMEAEIERRAQEIAAEKAARAAAEAQREERHTVTDFLTDFLIQGDSLFHTVHGILAKLPYHTADIRAKEHTVYHIVDHMLFFILIRIYPHATLLRGNRTCHIGCNIGIVEIIGLVTGGLQA